MLIGKSQGIDVPEIPKVAWIHVQQLTDSSLIPNVTDLGQGEAEVIALGIQYSNSLLILDDQLGRQIARLYHLHTTGTLGILLKAKQQGLITEVSPLIALLRQKGMWLSQQLINDVLDLADELNK